MEMIFFETAVIGVSVNDIVVVAVLDGPITNSRCVALLSCEKETAAALSRALRSALKRELRQ